MSKMLIGSINYSKLMEQAKIPHSAFTRGKDGKAYVNVQIWINDEPDKYGNTVSIQLNSTKEKRDSEEKVYIGNAKDLKAKTETTKPENNIPEYSDDLPF